MPDKTLSRFQSERWLPIAGYEGRYEVSDHGRVRGLDRLDPLGRPVRGGIRRQKKDRTGYFSISLNNGTRHKRHFLVHRLVLETFVGPCPDGMQACHFPDKNRGNNRLDNLRWDTVRANHADKIEHGTAQIGERANSVKLCDLDVHLIRDLGATCKRKDIAAWFGISLSNVYQILAGTAWPHLLDS